MAVQMRVILFLVVMSGFHDQLATSNGQNSNPCSIQDDGKNYKRPLCSQICDVINGTAQCSCQENFVLLNRISPENTGCAIKDQCAQNPPLCSPLVCEKHYRHQGVIPHYYFTHRCDCSPGFYYNRTSKTCLPGEHATGVDPCYQCSHGCVIVGGVSKCLCPGGYYLQPPEYTQCVANSTALQFCSRCSYSCINVNGTAQCDCPRGYELLAPENTMCVDVDECALSNPCSHPHSCENSAGDYSCKNCLPGYLLHPEIEVCHDINECWRAKEDGQSLCPDNSTCWNTVGSYMCNCNQGYTMVNGSCQSFSIIWPSSQQNESVGPSLSTTTHATESLPKGQSPSTVPHSSSPEATTGIIVGVIVSLIVLTLMMLALISIYICVRRGGCVCVAWRKKHSYVTMSELQQPSPEAGSEVVTSTDSVMKT